MSDSGSVVLPKMVSMSGQEICVAGAPAFIEKMCQKVTELDLMENKISRWEEVGSHQQCQLWAHTGADRSQMGQIQDFFRSDFNTFWL